MKKILILSMLVILNTSFLEANTATKIIEKFVNRVSKMTKGKVDDVVKQLPKRTMILEKPGPKKITLPKLSPKIKADPAKLLLVEQSGKIVSKGSFEKHFFKNQNFNNQLAVIVQNSKYGDGYFNVAKQVSHISPRAVPSGSPFVKYIHRSQLNEKTLQTKFVETLNETGKNGWEKIQKISTWVVNNKTVSGASGALAWYVLDHESFEKALEESGKTLIEFLGSIVGSLTQGAGEAITEKIEQVGNTIQKDVSHYMDERVADIKVSALKSVNVLVGLLLFILLFVGWRKRKVIQHFFTKSDEIKNYEHKENDNEF